MRFRMVSLLVLVGLVSCADGDILQPEGDAPASNPDLWDLVWYLESAERGDSLKWAGLFQPDAPSYGNRAIAEFLDPAGRVVAIEYVADATGWREAGPHVEKGSPGSLGELEVQADWSPFDVLLGSVSDMVGFLVYRRIDLYFDWPSQSGQRIVPAYFIDNDADRAEWLHGPEVHISDQGSDWKVTFERWRACRETSAGVFDCSKESTAWWQAFEISWGTGAGGSNLGAKRVYLHYNVQVTHPTQPVSVTPISGPTLIESPGQHTWSVTAAGGSPPFTFTWQLRRGLGSWSTVHTQVSSTGSQYARMISGPDEFELRVVVTTGTETATTPTLPVVSTVLTADIQGPNYAQDAGFYNYQANVSGGDGTYTYQWRAFWGGPGHIHYNTWQTLGTGSTQSIWIDQVSGDVTLELTVTSGSQVRTTLLGITNGIGCPEMEC